MSGAPEHLIMVEDMGTPAAYPSPNSDVNMDLGDVGNVEEPEGVGVLGPIMEPMMISSATPALNSVAGEEVPCHVRDGGDDSTAVAQRLVPGPVDIEMDGVSVELSCKTSEPEPE